MQRVLDHGVRGDYQTYLCLKKVLDLSRIARYFSSLNSKLEANLDALTVPLNRKNIVREHALPAETCA